MGTCGGSGHWTWPPPTTRPHNITSRECMLKVRAVTARNWGRGDFSGNRQQKSPYFYICATRNNAIESYILLSGVKWLEPVSAYLFAQNVEPQKRNRKKWRPCGSSCLWSATLIEPTSLPLAFSPPSFSCIAQASFQNQRSTLSVCYCMSVCLYVSVSVCMHMYVSVCSFCRISVFFLSGTDWASSVAGTYLLVHFDSRSLWL